MVERSRKNVEKESADTLSQPVTFSSDYQGTGPRAAQLITIQNIAVGAGLLSIKTCSSALVTLYCDYFSGRHCKLVYFENGL